MKASGIITVLGGVGALALLGLMVVMGGDATEPVRPPISEARVDSSSSPSPGDSTRRGTANPAQVPGMANSRPGAALDPSSGAAQRASPSTANASGSGVAPAQAQPGAAGAGETGAAGETGSTGAVGSPGQPSEVEKVLEVARKGERPDDRINALRWLGDNGTTQQFDALQNIQINDPSPEVRAAAELAVNALRARRANDSWPGVTPTKDPQDYMRKATSPSP
jgi:hypothetical protein